MITNLMALQRDHKITEKNATSYKKRTADFHEKSVVTNNERRKADDNMDGMHKNS